MQQSILTESGSILRPTVVATARPLVGVVAVVPEEVPGVELVQAAHVQVRQVAVVGLPLVHRLSVREHHTPETGNIINKINKIINKLSFILPLLSGT